MGILQASLISLLMLAATWQDQNATTTTDNTILSDEEIISEVVLLIRSSNRSGGIGGTELSLKRLIEQNPDSSTIPILKALLEAAQEQQAEHNFKVAMFYIIKRKALDAAMLRLEVVINKYPHYSHIDEAFYQLGIIKYRQGLAREAEDHFNRIIDDYPSSVRARDARRRLKKIRLNR